MQSLILKVISSMNRLLVRSEAQNLTEYSLAFSVIALGTVAGMSAVASGVNTTFSAVANAITAEIH